MRIIWRGMSLSLEEAGPTIKFADTLVHWDGSRYHITPHYLNSPTQHHRFAASRTRFVPSEYQEQRVPYLRTLVLGRIHRVWQISQRQTDLERGLWELMTELHRPPLRYSWSHLHRACQGVRLQWALGAVLRTRERLLFLMMLDGASRSA